jgi:hypothetical protein
VPSSGVRIAWSISATLAYTFVEYTVVSSGVTVRRGLCHRFKAARLLHRRVLKLA